MDNIFIDNRIKVKEFITSTAEAILEECAGEVESQVKRNTRVDTGKTKNSWQHAVYKTAEGVEAAIGSNYENAIWEEFGTGEYALQGNGRKSTWTYKDEKGQWHKTHGKKPRRALFTAFVTLKSSITSHIQNAFRGS